MFKTALVVEGGGMRGIFSAGILDAFAAVGFDPFDIYLGVSAGACNLASFVSSQPRRNHRNYTGPMSTRGFLSKARYLKGGDYLNLDWICQRWEREDPLDLATASAHLLQRQMLIVCTNVATGQAEYFSPTPSNWYQLQLATCALPFAYRRPVTIGDEHYYDGGLSDAIPVRKAYELGARKIVVLRSRALSYVKNVGPESRLLNLVFRKSPNLISTMQNRESNYMDSVNFIRTPPADAQIFELAPTEYQKTGRTTQDLKSLEHDYQMGHAMGDIFADNAAQILQS